MGSGGFNVIIGNPPYVEYGKVKGVYQLAKGQYQSEEADNLYAFCMERSTKLLDNPSNYGMIVPAGVLGLDDARPLRDVLLRRYARVHCSSYAIRPSKLFDGVDQRLCIFIGNATSDRSQTLNTTRYHHWNAEERATLLGKLAYSGSFEHSRLRRIPQIGGAEARSILTQLEKMADKRVTDYYARNRSGYLMHYHRSPRYWIRAMDFEQYFRSATRSRSIHHFRDLFFQNAAIGKGVGGILNSSLFFFWFISVGNGRNITGADVEEFPVGEPSRSLLDIVPGIFDRLMDDYRRHSFIREREDCEFQEFRPSKSKPIIDEIDRALAVHYGFTDEELDFIINYDIKYRLGQDGADEGDEA